ncbi:hypothetical protein ES703_57738 [subsurface metagenome]
MSNEKKPKNVGVSNPYALAEVILKKKVNWKRVDSQKLLEKTLDMPYEKLFDPKYESPLYAGLKLDPQTKTLARVEIPPTAKVVHRTLVNVGATTVWADPGDFFEEAAELTDPIQGAVANCYLIAALSSVAWARTYVIAQRTRATGTGPQDFVDMIEFKKGGKSEKVEVTELLPLNSPGNTFIYARSSEPGEIWPAVYEKAFAKWVTKDAGDKPNILKTAYGDPVGAAASLTGLTPYYYWNSSFSGYQIWQKVRGNCISRKTFNPMVAWTYGSSPSPDVNYSNAHIAANHAYSILGWQYANNQKYIVLRNPWGNYEAIINVAGSTWIAWDAPYYGGPGWWRPIPMATNDGIFALRADTFKKYFAGFGLLK